MWNESSDSSDEPLLSPTNHTTNHTIHELLVAQAPKLDWGSEEEQSPRSRSQLASRCCSLSSVGGAGRSLQLRRMEQAEHTASSQLQGALKGLHTRVAVSHAHRKRQSAAQQLAAAVRGGRLLND